MDNKKEYSKIVEELKSAKEIGVDSAIQGAVLNFTNHMLQVTKNTFSFQELAMFVYDQGMIFETKKNILSNSKPDTEIYSTGLLDQLLEMININNHKNISDSVSEAIGNLHSALSSGGKSGDIEKMKEILITRLNELKNLVG